MRDRKRVDLEGVGGIGRNRGRVNYNQGSRCISREKNLLSIKGRTNKKQMRENMGHLYSVPDLTCVIWLYPIAYIFLKWHYFILYGREILCCVHRAHFLSFVDNHRLIL